MTDSQLTALQNAMLDEVWDAKAKYLAAERNLFLSVATARENGLTWTQLGDLLGVTRSAVQQRFGKDLT
jgi:hypothetical protein